VSRSWLEATRHPQPVTALLILLVILVLALFVAMLAIISR
jgi:hypothetical protein